MTKLLKPSRAEHGAKKSPAVNNARRKSSGIPKSKPVRTASGPGLPSVMTKAEITQIGAAEALRDLHDALERIEGGYQKSRRNFVASAFEAARALKDDEAQLVTFCEGEFWGDQPPKFKTVAKDPLRYALIRLCGNTPAGRSTASEWATPLKSAFAHDEPAESVPKLLAKAAREKTAKRKAAAQKKGGPQLSHVLDENELVVSDLGRISTRDTFMGVVRGKMRIEFVADADKGLKIDISCIPVSAPLTPITSTELE